MTSADKDNLSQVVTFFNGNPTTDADRVKAPMVSPEATRGSGGAILTLELASGTIPHTGEKVACSQSSATGAIIGQVTWRHVIGQKQEGGNKQDGTNLRLCLHHLS